MSLHRGLHREQGRRLFAATAVMALGLVMGAAPSFAVGDVYVCKVVGHEGNYSLQAGNNPIFVAIGSTGYADAFADSHPSFVLQPGDYSGAEPTFGDCDAKWAPRPGISVVKTATVDGANTNGKADAGETIAYSFLVTNTGNVTLTGVEVVDPRLVSAVTCAATTLARGGTTTCTPAAAYTVTDGDVVNGADIVNQATASGQPPTGSPVTDTDMVSTPTQLPQPGISVVKTATVDGANTNGKADAGETIAYSFLVTNTGGVTLTGVEVVDPRLVSAVTCAATTLARGASTTCTPAAAYTVTEADVADGADIVNQATASGQPPTGSPVTDTDTVSTPTQLPQPGISVVKTATVDGANTNGKADAGETITYSFLVTNTGDVTLTGVEVVDLRLVSAVTCAATTLARGASTTCTPAAAYTVTEADVADGADIVNQATASGQPPTGSPVTDTDTVSTPTQGPAVVPDFPAISVDKTYVLSGIDDLADAGETITYSFLVTNTGNMPLFDVAVVDLMLDELADDPAVTCGAEPLEPQEDVTCTADGYIVTSTDVQNGEPILNEATASAHPLDSEPVSDTDETSTPTRQPTQSVGLDAATISPRITLKAAVVNDAGGNAEVSDFTLTGSSIETHEEAVQHSSAIVAAAETTSFSGVTGAAAITNAVVPVGTYFLSESALPSGYSASAWACTGGQLNGSLITVALGNTVDCVITNTYSSTVVDSIDVPSADPASPRPAVLVVDKAASRATTPAVTTPTVTTLAFTGSGTVPLSLLALFALVLGVALTVAGRRQGSHWARE